MSAALLVGTASPAQQFATWLCTMRGRYEALSAEASTSERRVVVARLGVKLGELLTFEESCSVEARDARSFPCLALWLDARFVELESKIVDNPDGMRASAAPSRWRPAA
jgi:hypothetical protein